MVALASLPNAVCLYGPHRAQFQTAVEIVEKLLFGICISFLALLWEREERFVRMGSLGGAHEPSLTFTQNDSS